jgi:hypothetical protein
MYSVSKVLVEVIPYMKNIFLYPLSPLLNTYNYWFYKQSNLGKLLSKITWVQSYSTCIPTHSWKIVRKANSILNNQAYTQDSFINSYNHHCSYHLSCRMYFREHPYFNLRCRWNCRYNLWLNCLDYNSFLVSVITSVYVKCHFIQSF